MDLNDKDNYKLLAGYNIEVKTNSGDTVKLGDTELIITQKIDEEIKELKKLPIEVVDMEIGKKAVKELNRRNYK